MSRKVAGKREEVLVRQTKKSAEPKHKTDAPASRVAALGVEAIVSLVGEKVAALRRARGMSLQQLAEISDVSPGAIHKIERSGMTPTITTLLKLANAFGVSVGYFVEEDEGSPEPVHYTKVDTGRPVYTPHKGLNLSGITGSYRQFRTAAAIARMAPGATSGEKVLSHTGEELVHVTSGEVVFRVNGREYTLASGDSLQFSGTLPHYWENRTSAVAELIWVVFRDSD